MCGIKINSENEAVSKIWQNKYKKMWQKLSDFFCFLWITFENAIMSALLQILWMNGRVLPTRVWCGNPGGYIYTREKNIN